MPTAFARPWSGASDKRRPLGAARGQHASARCVPVVKNRISLIEQPTRPASRSGLSGVAGSPHRLESGVCGVRADEYVLNAQGPDVHGRVVKLNFGCVDERWLIRRNESGVPPDRTLECAVDYWWSDAGASGRSGASVETSRGGAGGSLDAGRGSRLP